MAFIEYPYVQFPHAAGRVLAERIQRLILLQRGIVGALAANFAAIPFFVIVTFRAPALARTLLLCLAS